MGQQSAQEVIAHGCDLTVVSCMDFRLHLDLGPAIRECYGGSHIQYDFISLAGSCHRFVRESPSAFETLMHDLSTSISKHSPETIALIQHQQCAVYLDKFDFPNTDVEQAVLAQDAIDAEKVIKAVHSNVTVHRFLATIGSNNRFERLIRL